MKSPIPRMVVLLAGCIAVAVLGVWVEAQQTVKSAIDFKVRGAGCISVKQDMVHARSSNVVLWQVSAEPACKFEGKTVAIVFTSGGDPGSCHCSADLVNNSARLTLTVKPHKEHRTYMYDILVGGQRIADPRLEVDP